MHAVGYCRAERASVRASDELAEQRQAIVMEVARRGWTLSEVFEDIADGHGLLGREGLHRALSAVESRQARALIVTEAGRLSATLEDFSWLVQSSRRRGWLLVSIAELATSGDVPGLDLLPVIAQFAPVICYVTFDCARPDALADFWAAATGFRKESSAAPDDYAVVSDLSGRSPALWFNKVPEPKVVKNRVHICLNVHSLEAEVGRLSALGADKAAEHSSPSGKTWVIMRDPEGNEFCVLPVSQWRYAPVT